MHVMVRLRSSKDQSIQGCVGQKASYSLNSWHPLKDPYKTPLHNSLCSIIWVGTNTNYDQIVPCSPMDNSP